MKGGSFRGLVPVLRKEFIHLRRDSMTIVIALFVPAVQLVILGFAIDTNVRQVPTALWNLDNRQASREFLDRLAASDTYRFVEFPGSDAGLNEAIVSGRCRVGIKIPVDFSDRLAAGDPAEVLVLIDGSDSSVAAQALNVATSVGLDESIRWLVAPRRALPVSVRPKLLFNPDSRSPNFFIPGLLAVLLLFVTTFLSAVAIVREKERGTLEQLFVTPVRPMGLLVGKLLAYLVIAILELGALLVLMVFAFRVPIHGNPILLLALSLPYLFVNLCLGLLISSKARTQAEAIQMSMMVILPTIFFSGYIFPRATMPLGFWLLSFLVPGTYFVEISRGVILRGAGIAHLWPNGLALVTMGVIVLRVAALRFRKKVIAA